MPTPIQILLDPVSLMVFAIYACLIVVEALFPARALPKVKGWLARSIAVFIIYFYLASYLPLLWDKFLASYQLLDLGSMNVYISALIAMVVYQFVLYLWHRAIHQSNLLWRLFHQMHHSVERIDTFGAFYFSPLDMIGFTMIGSLSSVLIIGVSPQAATYFIYMSMFMAIFSHTNIKTPQWLGYIIQRPESHAIHHGTGIHRYNYAELPIFDILFGTFRNPKNFNQEAGFYTGASARIADMLMFRDVSHPKQKKQHRQGRCIASLARE